MATTQLPGQDIPIQLPDRQIEPVWYGWFRYVASSVKSMLSDIATNTTNIATNTASIAAHESAWTAYTPTVTSSAGAVGAAAGCRYKQIGKTVHLRLGVTISTGGGSLTIALPSGMSAATVYPATYLVGRENNATGVVWLGLVGYPTAGLVTPFNYANSPAVTAGWRIDLSGTIEIA